METPVEFTPLETLGDLLLESDYIVTLQEAGEETPVDKLYIEVGELEEETLVLQAIVLNEFFDYTEDRETDEEQVDVEPEATMVQFWLVLPFEIEADGVEAIKVSALINRLLPLGYFGVSLQDKSCYLQYTLPVDGNDITPLLAFETVNMLAFAATEYGPVLARAARGELTAETYSAEMERAGMALPPVPVPPRIASLTDVGEDEV